MGGRGSGRPAGGGKELVEHHPSIVVRQLYANNAPTQMWHDVSEDKADRHQVTLTPFEDHVDGFYVWLDFNNRPRGYDRFQIRVSWMQCHYGGRRAWFHCPSCEERAWSLFFAPPEFACRKCADLRYRSQRVGPQVRKLERLKRIADQLDDAGNGGLRRRRPPGMPMKKFARLAAAYEQAWHDYLNSGSAGNGKN